MSVSGYTGVQTPHQPGPFVDYLAGTFPADTNLDDLAEPLDVRQWTHSPRGARGYRQGLKCGDLTVLFDGRPDMGIYLEASGSGCRQLESAPNFEDWPALIRTLLQRGYRASRVDIALDDQARHLDFATMKYCSVNRLVVSPYRNVRVTTRRRGRGDLVLRYPPERHDSADVPPAPCRWRWEDRCVRSCRA
jgi:hypothetical protein